MYRLLYGVCQVGGCAQRAGRSELDQLHQATRREEDPRRPQTRQCHRQGLCLLWPALAKKNSSLAVVHVHGYIVFNFQT